MLETYDASRLIAKPVFPSDYLRLMQEKASLVAEEKGLEREVLRDISRQIAQELDALAGYVAAVTRLDDYLARARLSLAFEMTRPQLQEWGAPISVQDGRYIPQAERCRALDLPYTPVNARFDRRVTVTTPLKTPGVYLLTARVKDGNVSKIVIWVSDTAIVHKQLAGKNYYFVADAVSGEPIAGANVEFGVAGDEPTFGSSFEVDDDTVRITLAGNPTCESVVCVFGNGYAGTTAVGVSSLAAKSGAGGFAS